MVLFLVLTFLLQVEVPPPGTPIYLLPEGVTAVTVQHQSGREIPVQNIPIIDCQVLPVLLILMLLLLLFE